MFNITTKTIEWGGRTLTLETGRMARQADGAVLATYGGTTVLCTVVAQKKAKPDVDFFPLTVNYLEKYYAAGKIPGGFLKRESRPTDRETLTSRLIDRPIRPLFHDSFRNETQVICTVVSHDLENSPDIVAMVGASAALTISGVPFLGPIGGARVGYIDGEYVLNPQVDEMDLSDLDLVVAGTSSSVLMVESEAKELPEDIMLGAVMFGHEQMQPVIDMIIDLAETCAKEPWEIEVKETDPVLKAKVSELAEAGLREAYAIQDKQERSNRISELKDSVLEAVVSEEVSETVVQGLFKKLEKEIVRGNLLKTGTRIDGRDTKTVRQLDIQVGVLPRVHGSALFTRGETQALVVLTLGNAQDEQIIDALEGDYRDKFMLHYNFPPYSVGEAGFLRAPGRREIGHGKLAKRALQRVMPTAEEFPYTLRLVSEVTESNGSSSMASVCGSSLALMDAGVPIGASVSGIAMGLVKEGDEFVVLSDIMGDEDHLGDMDFKVAGTANGLTALQMDIKIDGITEEIMRIALDQAGEGRAHIREAMDAVINTARGDVSEHAPKMTTLQIKRDKIREVIGSGGAVIREICEVTKAKIDIEDDGKITIFATNAEQAKAAQDWIENIVAEPEVGVIYEGKVVSVVDFGAFVRIVGTNEGLLHISELADHRVEKVTDMVNEGDMVKVKVLDIDRGKIRLSMRVVDQETGEDISDQVQQRPAPSSSRKGGGDRDQKPRRRAGGNA